ncbi:MAG: hypothetical protein JOZ02_08490 [Acidobacteria bacterium]|nr:hypothetical protein [Acidobacteriota bacterium]
MLGVFKQLVQEVVRKFKGRIVVFTLSLAVGLALALLCKVAVAPLASREEKRAAVNEQAPPEGCAGGDTFASPEEVAGALRSEDVGVRREMFRRLFVLPGLTTAYYDYERDRDFPERAEGLRLRRVNLDRSPEEEALVTFVRVESPVAVVLKRQACGWKAVAAVSSWLRFEDYPYEDWLETPEAIQAGRHLLLVRDSTGDATRYTRRARLLSLVGDHLEQVAEIEEETISPFENYKGDDWAELKRRRTATVEFVPPSAGSPARLNVEYREEVVRYSGVEPPNVYWREDDGAWHQARGHWRTRHREVIKPAVVSEEQFVWSEQKSRFVKAGS